MEEEKKLLEVGDKVYCIHHSAINSIYTITRVTAKRAFSRVHETYEREFKREVLRGNDVDEVGRQRYGPSYQLETPELKAKWERSQLTYKIKKRVEGIRFDLLDVEKLREFNTQLDALGL